MADQIKMNYPMMEEMAQALSNGAEVLDDVLAEIISIASSLEDGGLLGDAGDALAEALRGPFATSIVETKTQLLEETQKDVLDAMEEMKTSDQTSKGLY